MTASVWTTILLAVISFVQAGLVFSFTVGKWATRRELSSDDQKRTLDTIFDRLRALDAGAATMILVTYRVTELEKTLDDAGERTSKLATYVQGLEEKLRRDFITRDECDIRERRKGNGPS